MTEKKTINVRILVLSAMLAAAAAAISWLEHFIPIQAIIPLPGLKLGLANIITMFAIFFLGIKPTFAIVVIRCVLGAAFGGGITAFAFSITGATMAAVVMMLLKLGYEKQFSLYGISLAGSAAFNIGQVIVAAFILQDAAIFSYLPMLMIGGVITGVVTAVVSSVVFKKIDSSKVVKRYIKILG